MENSHKKQREGGGIPKEKEGKSKGKMGPPKEK